MKTDSKIALGALAVGAAAFLLARKHTKGASGIGKVRTPYIIPSSILKKAKSLFDAYDRAIEIEREHDAKCDAIYENLQERGIDPYADENERVVIDALYNAGLTDENGLTDVMMNRHNARKELFDYINANIVTLFPIPASDKEALKSTRSIVYQNLLLDITRDFVNKQLEHKRNIREILSGEIGKVEHSDYDGARIITKNGLHAISFDIYGSGENGITVTAEMKGGGERYGFSWEYLSHIGDYKTLSGAIKAASKYAMTHGWVFDSDDFKKL